MGCLIMRNDVIYLIREARSHDENGMPVVVKSKSKVYCNMTSITANEFFTANQAGIQAQYRFTMFAPEYHGEKLVEYRDAEYSVYRTYQQSEDLLELYVEARASNEG